MNFNKWRDKFLIIGVVLFCAAQPAAFAASSLGFGSVVGPTGAPLTLSTIQASTGSMPNGLLEGFWSDPSGADPRLSTSALKIASSISTFNISPANSISDVPPSSKYFVYQNAGGYYFWRFNDDNSPGAAVYVRLWSSDAKTYYTYDSFANGAKADSPHTMNVAAAAWYKAAKPDTPLITQFDEIATCPIPSRVKSGSLKVTSVPGPVTDGQRQINSYAWQRGTSADNLTAVSGANSPVLTLDLATLTVGQTYYFKVIYTNWFGSTASAVENYTVSGAPGGPGGREPVTITVPLSSTGLGLNVIAYDFDTTKGAITYVDNSGTSVTIVPQDGHFTIQNLINAVNNQAGTAIVKTVGYYDNAAKKQVGLTAVAANLANSTATAGDTTASILAHEIKEPLQISVSANADGSTRLLSFTLNGTK